MKRKIIEGLEAVTHTQLRLDNKSRLGITLIALVITIVLNATRGHCV